MTKKLFLLVLSVMVWGGCLAQENPGSPTRGSTTPQMDEASLIKSLRETEISPSVRRQLVTTLSRFSSPRTRDVLYEISRLDPDSCLRRQAKEALYQVQNALYGSDIPILSFRYSYPDKGGAQKSEDEVFLMTRREFQESLSLYHGNVRDLLRNYILGKFLDIERKKHAGELIQTALYDVPRPLLSEEELAQRIELECDRLFREFSQNPALVEAKKNTLVSESVFSVQMLDYYGVENIRNFLWREWWNVMNERIRLSHMAFAREEMLESLTDKKMRLSGRSRDDVGPEAGYNFFRESRAIFEDFIRQHPFETITPEVFKAFTKDRPEMEFLVVSPKAYIQGVWFTLPSLREYQGADFRHLEETRARIHEFYEGALSQDFLKWCIEQSLSIFSLLDNPNPSPFPFLALTPRKALIAKLEQEKAWVATQLAQGGGVRGDIREITEQAIHYVFEAARQKVLEEKSESYPAALAMKNALEVVIGDYLVMKKDEFSDSDRYHIGLLLRFSLRRIETRMKDLIFDYLVEKKIQLEEIYKRLVKEGDSPTSGSPTRGAIERKSEVFRTIVEEFKSEWPLEVVFINPDWVEQGGEGSLPEIDQWSFGKDRKQLGETEVYYSFFDPQPSVSVFQWIGYQEGRFVDFNEERNGTWVGKLIEDFLVYKHSVSLRSKVESELYHTYRLYLEFFGVPGLQIDLDTLFSR